MSMGFTTNEAFKLPAELTIYHIEEFLSTLGAELAAKTEIILDASDLEHIDASGLQMLIAGAKEAEIKKKSFLLLNPRENLRHILSVTGASKVVSVREEVGDEPDSNRG